MFYLTWKVAKTVSHFSSPPSTVQIRPVTPPPAGLAVIVIPAPSKTRKSFPQNTCLFCATFINNPVGRRFHISNRLAHPTLPPSNQPHTTPVPSRPSLSRLYVRNASFLPSFKLASKTHPTLPGLMTCVYARGPSSIVRLSNGQASPHSVVRFRTCVIRKIRFCTRQSAN
ncbi:hypothetical protein GWI33_016762 [Rhynchophorus ferrugineus]|uniref:Uncharacterized protein n=1 Tax=Rhynchophorus ferrugineus TaxID=354439 RepID=A0A834M9Z2_RHYFE|nr:hypothetical protein GWI33_016762 [Rhynchophorus ferrugineus]